MTGFTRKRGRTWTAYWSSTDPGTGGRRQHTKGGFATRREAEEHLGRIIGAVQDGSWRPDRALTVRQLLDEHWLPAQRSRGLRATTLAQYGHVTASWLNPHLGAVKVAALTPAHVQHLSDELERLSPRSRQLAVGTLKSACAWAVSNGLIRRNPVAGVRRPRVEQTQVQPWTAEEARRFLTATAADRLGFAWALLLTRGLRRGELCGLRWSDVDLDGGTLHVTRARVVVDGQTVDSAPKTRAGRRMIPLDQHLVALLRTHKARQAAERLAAGPAYADGGWLLADHLGQPVHPETVSSLLERAIAGAGLRRIRLHDLRHTAASLMLADGVPVKVVADLLGHASPTVTLSVYAHVLPGMAEQAGEALSGALLG